MSLTQKQTPINLRNGGLRTPDLLYCRDKGAVVRGYFSPRDCWNSHSWPKTIYQIPGKLIPDLRMENKGGVSITIPSPTSLNMLSLAWRREYPSDLLGNPSIRLVMQLDGDLILTVNGAEEVDPPIYYRQVRSLRSGLIEAYLLFDLDQALS